MGGSDPPFWLCTCIWIVLFNIGASPPSLHDSIHVFYKYKNKYNPPPSLSLPTPKIPIDQCANLHTHEKLHSADLEGRPSRVQAAHVYNFVRRRWPPYAPKFHVLPEHLSRLYEIINFLPCGFHCSVTYWAQSSQLLGSAARIGFQRGKVEHRPMINWIVTKWSYKHLVLLCFSIFQLILFLYQVEFAFFSNPTRSPRENTAEIYNKVCI